VTNDPTLLDRVRAEGGTPLAEFAGNGNTQGVGRLLDLGVDVAALYESGERGGLVTRR
jgi:hypothetical protein